VCACANHHPPLLRCPAWRVAPSPSSRLLASLEMALIGRRIVVHVPDGALHTVNLCEPIRQEDHKRRSCFLLRYVLCPARRVPDLNLPQLSAPLNDGEQSDAGTHDSAPGGPSSNSSSVGSSSQPWWVVDSASSANRARDVSAS